MLIFVFRTLNVGIRYLSKFRIPNLCSFFMGDAWKRKKTYMYSSISSLNLLFMSVATLDACDLGSIVQKAGPFTNTISVYL